MTPRWVHVNDDLDVCHVQTGAAPITVIRGRDGWQLRVGVVYLLAGALEADAQIIVPLEGDLRFELGHALLTSDAAIDEEADQ